MSVLEFKRRLAACRTVREAEQLLALWFTVHGTYQELSELRDAVIAKWETLADDKAEVGGRGGVNAEMAAA